MTEEEYRKYCRLYYAKNKKRKLAQQKAYKERHKLKIRARIYEAKREKEKGGNRIIWSKKKYGEYSEAHLVYQALVDELRRRGIKISTRN